MNSLNNGMGEIQTNPLAHIIFSEKNRYLRHSTSNVFFFSINVLHFELGLFFLTKIAIIFIFIGRLWEIRARWDDLDKEKMTILFKVKPFNQSQINQKRNV